MRFLETESKKEEGIPYNRFNNPGQNMPDLANISDDQLKMSIDMMKKNPEMFKNMMRAQGMNVDDSQLDMMTSMMTPEMFRMAQNMQKSGVDPTQIMGNQNAGGARATPSTAGGGLPNFGNENPDAMNNMRNEIFKNPEMLSNIMKMMSSDPNNPMMKMLQQQFPNVSAGTLSKVIKVIYFLMLAYAKVRLIWSYTVTKIILF